MCGRVCVCPTMGAVLPFETPFLLSLPPVELIDPHSLSPSLSLVVLLPHAKCHHQTSHLTHKVISNNLHLSTMKKKIYVYKKGLSEVNYPARPSVHLHCLKKIIQIDLVSLCAAAL